ncbi:hypothetical protein NDU88_008100 [Pleurodeles waltl]|uniref:Uncharacterized protein n=1 Tax=Pleurodeles waltl TaxID=8319 RepID=A0AAV7PPF2_PLEWA|nr:hypothetical protein NDU88_008100 [Pleurodeles waltl]
MEEEALRGADWGSLQEEMKPGVDTSKGRVQSVDGRTGSVQVPATDNPSWALEGSAVELGHSLPQPTALRLQKLPGATVRRSDPLPRADQRSRQAHSSHASGLSLVRCHHPRQAAGKSKGPQGPKKPPPPQGHGSPGRHSTAGVPKLRGPQLDPAAHQALAYTLAPGRAHLPGAAAVLLSPLHQKERGPEDNTRPARSPTAAPDSAAPAAL